MKEKLQNKKTLIGIGIIVLLIIIAGLFNTRNNNDERLDIPEMEIIQSSDNRNGKRVEVNTNGKVDIKQLNNYQENKAMDAKIQDNRIKICSIGSYSGPYVEDGSDAEIDNVLAIVVTNTSKEFLQYSQIILTDGQKQATFAVSNIPSGASALVLSKEKISAEGTWTYQDDTTAFIKKTSLYEDTFSWQAGNNMVRVTNKSDKDFKTVHVYYKNVENGIYVGGITYRVTCENLKANETIQRLSKHFNGKQSQIMMIDYLK